MSGIRTWIACASLAALSLLASACILAPGKFDATLDLRRDGHFSFTYTGQIHLLALSELASMANRADEDEEFVEQPCIDDEDFEERPCTAEEAAQQRDEWEADSAARKQRAEDSSEAMQALFGGIDPANPQAAEELAQRLQRQEGWKRVDYRGDGLFDVEFAIESRLGHDFMFPTLERFPMVNSFVLANLRQGNQVRIEAPGFAAQGGGNPFAGMMSGMAGMASVAAGASGSGANLPKIPDLDGTFRIVTDGRILANNTDEGPAETPRGQVLEWRINARTQSPPMALIALGD
ncbi:MAG: hypothetical protein B7Z33_04690 [Sphingomonadales bacterium 12-68-11]|nr:MAG: hypothetical protein B7Z33_04690 [Sphingomonadales bacterium 12-68-11]